MGKKEAPDGKAMQEICRFYDVVRVDVEERSNEMQEEEMSLEDKRLLSSHLPLLREFIPSAAADVESDICDCMSKPDDYVYDYYTVSDAMELDDKGSLCPFPLVTMKEEEFYGWPDDNTEYETDDSNAEAHPHNEYPDETSQEEEEEEEEDNEEDEESSSSEEEDGIGRSSKFKELRYALCEDEIYDGHCTFDYDDDSDDDGED